MGPRVMFEVVLSELGVMGLFEVVSSELVRSLSYELRLRLHQHTSNHL